MPIRQKVIWALSALGLSLFGNSLATGKEFAPPVGPAAEAQQIAQAALADGQPDAMSGALQKIAELLPPPSPLGEQAIAAVATANASTKSLRLSLEKIGEALAFVPRSEAELPKGFPTYTPVGVIEVKQYPARRRAQAKGFFTLFRHISSNDIAMTTPVRMEFTDGPDGKLRQQNMSFYYGSPETGTADDQAGRQNDKVAVVDSPASLVIAIGMRGYGSANTMTDTKARLEKWIALHPEYQPTGPLQMMGYNSPRVQGNKRFFEVQMPVVKTKTAK